MGYATTTTPNYGSGTKTGADVAAKGEAITKKIEQHASKIPPATFLALAGGAIAISLGLAAGLKKKGWANFVGLWAPTFLLFGVYEKLIKMEENTGGGGSFAADTGAY